MSDIDRQATESDVKNCYELFLGRPPESEDAVRRHLATTPTVRALRSRFLSSPEFYRNNVRVLADHVVRRALTLNTGEVQTAVSEEQLHQLFAHIQASWSELGTVEPHFSVVSQPKFKPDSIRENRDAFDASGRTEVEALGHHLQKVGKDPSALGVAIELGCGVGRVTRYLAERCSVMHAYDVSQPHLDLARDYLANNATPNAHFHKLGSLVDVEFPVHDFFYSRIVLQHNPPPVTLFLLHRVLRKLRPGGIAVFQAITEMEGYSFQADEYLSSSERVLGQELHVVPQHAVFRIISESNCLPMRVVRDTSVSGFDRVSNMFYVKRSS